MELCAPLFPRPSHTILLPIQLTRGLAKSQDTQQHDALTRMEQLKTVMEDSAHCMVCERPLTTNGLLIPFYRSVWERDAVIVSDICSRMPRIDTNAPPLFRYPNGVITCTSCMKDPTVCPKTGTHFKTRVLKRNK